MNEIQTISSRENRRLVNARKVRDGKVPDQIFIEGRRLVSEALSSNLEIGECLVVEAFSDRKLLDAVCKTKSAITEIPVKIFNSIADTEHSQGIILIAKRPKTSAGTIEGSIGSAALPVVIFLNEINNPSNLGAVMRTAEAAGVALVIISTNSANAFSPKALRSAMGASFRMLIWENAEFDQILRWADEKELTVTAADIYAKESYLQTDWRTPRLLVLGSEAHGLSDADLKKIRATIRIPMEQDAESLNLAVSVGIILFEARRQNI
ncbi:MAG: RNA methyltransferase [Pyrinomonadaceae bacterium]